MQTKPKLSFWQIWNMSFGFFGIQIGFGLQSANMGRIYQTLGANVEDLPIYFLAAPLTGLIVQPIIGYLSDRTWNPTWRNRIFSLQLFGRRKPYFLIGALLSSLALLYMPHSPTVWVAVGMLWILDASINISMEPFRALVADKLPPEQRTEGFTMQSILIGSGAVIASVMPWLFTKLGVSNEVVGHQIPPSVILAFTIGAICFFGAILWTVYSTDEYPPDDPVRFEQMKKQSQGVYAAFVEIMKNIFDMPRTMKQLAVVQFFTWFALFSLFIYNTPAITGHIYGTDDTTSAAYNQGANWIGIGFAVFNGIAALFGFILPYIARVITRKMTHLTCLVLGGIGLIAFYFIPRVAPGEDSWLMLGCFALLGIAWSSILSMPYAMLSGGVPPSKMGVYMGVFNFFICIPQIIASLEGLNFLSRLLVGPEPIHALILGGIFMIIAGVATLFVDDVGEVVIHE